MAIPSGSGTEVLKGFGANALDDTTWSISTKASGSTYNLGLNHIATILSITACNMTGSAVQFDFGINDGTNTISITHTTGNSLPAYSTYVFNDKLVMGSGCHLVMYSGDTFDWWVTLIDQDWS